MESVKEQHRENIEQLQQIAKLREKKDRPLYIAVFHGSGRHTTESCAHEIPNSQMLLERGLELAQADWKGRELEVESHVLREYFLEPCNGCYSTASAMCNFSCTCFPGDDITTKIYPAIMKADVMLWSTPVNQSMVSTRVKTVLDRLISLDGGYFIPELPIKDSKFRAASQKLSQKDVRYDSRMFGKVAAYFITSKDFANPLEESAPYPKEFRGENYDTFTAGAIAHQGAEYGWFHADPWFAISTATHDRELQYDKDEYDGLKVDHEYAKMVVTAALDLGEKHIDKPPKLTSKGRVNRT